MKKILFMMVLLILSSSINLVAQMKGLRGDFTEYRTGVFDGNLFRINFNNDGMPGGDIEKGQYGGEWPINAGNWYLLDGVPKVCAEVRDNVGVSKGALRHIQVMVKNNCTAGNNCGDRNANTGEWETFLPLPGFANPERNHIAMAKGGVEVENSWPSYWPDIADPENPIYNPDGWAGSWNGYFGRDVFNADQEAYIVADDYAKKTEFPNFRPDTNDLSRGGLGIRMYARGFQWTKTLVQDGLFVLYDLKNIGTYDHKKIVFGFKIGNNMGHRNTGSDAGDDGGYFMRAEDLAYTYDNDGTTNASGWKSELCVGLMGGAFLESPGNPYDGIDNDNDGKNSTIRSTILSSSGPITVVPNSGNPISESMFAPKIIELNTPIVLINYASPTFDRKLTTLKQALTEQGKSDADTLMIVYGQDTLKIWDGCTVQEDTMNGSNLLDDNLNGVIDESRGVASTSGLYNYLYLGYLCRDYLDSNPQTNGSLNPLIDEKRDDGIDNNDSWNPETDDVGKDGLGPIHIKYRAPDEGESNGLPNEGEPRFDGRDIYETDMIGLTSFQMYDFGGTLGPEFNDENQWNMLRPGTFTKTFNIGNVELLFGSGYFPMPPGKTERFSMGLMAGRTGDRLGSYTDGKTLAESEDPSFIGDLLRNKREFQRAYASNYNFAKAPVTPKITAVLTGDKRVTIFWDDDAERLSYDDFADTTLDPKRIDFEGYKVYRATYPDWSDLKVVTDYNGRTLWHLPIAQYDLVNSMSGFFPIMEFGAHFYLGANTGLRHYFIDSTLTNGVTYYYAVTSYDHGSPSGNITPSECAKYAVITSSGEFQAGTNVVRVKPEAPSAGFVDAKLGDRGIIPGPNNTAQGKVDLKIVNRDWIKNNRTYKIVFEQDTATVNVPGAALDLGIVRKTKNFSLIDITPGPKDSVHRIYLYGKDTVVVGDTILNKYSLEGDAYEGLPVVDGFKLTFSNNPKYLRNNRDSSGWNRSGIREYNMVPFTRYYKSGNVYYTKDTLISADFEIIISNVGVDTSKSFQLYKSGPKPNLPSIPVNFTVWNKTTNTKVPFAFHEMDSVGGREKQFTLNPSTGAGDRIILLVPTPTPSNPDSLIPSWTIALYDDKSENTAQPNPGNVLTIKLDKPFLAHDTYEFTTSGAYVDNQLAKSELNKIKVVPNPYIVTNAWEPRNEYIVGARDREIHFTHLPANCVIRIYNVRGQLVNTIYHNSSINDGTATWNLLSKDRLEIAYGVYIYHVQAEGIGEKIGKFAIIK